MISRVAERESGITSNVLLPFLPFLILGLTPAYFVLCGYVNETRIKVDEKIITVAHHPLPWFGNMRIFTGNLVELYITRNPSARHNSWGAEVWGGEYSVWLTLATGKQEQLLSGLDTIEHARFVKQVIERHLRIEGRPGVKAEKTQ
jgi:hypothetical protein